MGQAKMRSIKEKRLLLESAAKAMYGDRALEMMESGWNPIENDGDAFRAAILKRISIDLDEPFKTFAYNHSLEIDITQIGVNTLAESRMAITKALAAISIQEGK